MDKKADVEMIKVVFAVLIAAVLLIIAYMIFGNYIKGFFSNEVKTFDSGKISPKEIPAEILDNVKKHESKINLVLANIQEDQLHSKVSKNLIIALVSYTSAGNQRFISECGSVGIIPLMPSTANIFGLKVFDDSRLIDCSNKAINTDYALKLKDKIFQMDNEEIKQIDQRFDSDKSIEMGIDYLSRLLKKFNNEEAMALSAFYMSPDFVEKNCKGGFSSCSEKNKEMKDFVVGILANKKYLDNINFSDKIA